MNFTEEQIKKAKEAKNAEELFALAKENDVEMTKENAEYYYAELHKYGELSDEELDAIAGGKEEENPAPRFANGQHLWMAFDTTRNYLEFVIDSPEFYTKDYGWRYLVTYLINGCTANEYPETDTRVLTYDPGSEWIF